MDFQEVGGSMTWIELAVIVEWLQELVSFVMKRRDV
jgi:hypothetical protein